MLLGLFQGGTVATSHNTTYHAGNCLLIRLDAQLKEKWTTLLARKVSSWESPNCGFVTFYNREKDVLYVLFADHVVNTGNDLQDAAMLVFGALLEGGNLKEECIAVCRIDGKGVVNKEHVMPYKECNFKFGSFDFFRIENKSLIYIPSGSGEVIQLYNIRLK